MRSFSIGNRDLIRAINRSIILNTIKTYGSVDRAKIARLTGLSPATVTGISAELIEEGLIFEKEPGDSRGGRRPILLAINPQGAYVVGVKLMEGHLTGALTDLEATIISRRTISLLTPEPETVVNTMAQLVEQLLLEAGISQHKLIGIGMGMAGIVDSANGVLRQTPYFPWRNLPLGEMLQARLQVPVYIDNDVNTLTLAERWFGAGQGIDHFLTVTVGRGVGLGIVVNGQFYRGATGGAGEFGHTVLRPDGPMCECGKRGCLEALAGDHGLLRAAAEAAESGELAVKVNSVDELLALAQAGDPAALKIFQQAGEALGQGIANLINIFNPQRVILSGEGVRYGEIFFASVRSAMAQFTMPGLYAEARLHIEPWGDDAWARGAASLVLRSLFESPVHEGSAKL
jgi:glucokinase-like ROK family protein